MILGLKKRVEESSFSSFKGILNPLISHCLYQVTSLFESVKLLKNSS